MTVDSFNAFIDKWIRPSTIVIVFGAIVWGVQLNFITLEQAKSISALQKEVSRVREQQVKDEFDLQKTAILLERTSANLAKLREDYYEHAREAERWKQRILSNEERTKPLNNRGSFQ